MVIFVLVLPGIPPLHTVRIWEVIHTMCVLCHQSVCAGWWIRWFVLGRKWEVYSCSVSHLAHRLWFCNSCPMPWAVPPSGFWCLAALCSPGSCPLPSSLKVKSCTQSYGGASDVFQNSSIHSNSPHKVSFLPPRLKSRTKMGRDGKRRSRTFKSNAAKTGRRL